MEKELDKKLKLDSINWVEVIKGLGGKTTFKDHDIKRALRKTGRSFNNNGPFHTTVRSFIEALGNTVSSTLSSGQVVYTITSTEDAIKAVDRKRKTTKTGLKKTQVIEKVTLENPKPISPIVSDEDKIRGFFKKSYSRLEQAIYLLAVFVKHGEKEIPSKTIRAELTDLGINYTTIITSSKSTISDIYKTLGFNELHLGKSGTEYVWELKGTGDLLDEYTRLCDSYEKLTGNKFKNLDNYIISKTSKEETKRKYEVIEKLFEKKTPREPRIERDPEIMWKKWLLILSSRNFFGESKSIDNLISWIKTDRHYIIDKEESKKLYRELMEDSEKELCFHPSDCVSMTDKAWKKLSKFYSPTKFKETIFVKLPFSLEIASKSFNDLKIKLDDTTTSGMYLYSIEIDRSIKCEFALKKLLRLIQISGKIYSTESWMVKRVMEIISEEDSNKKSKETILLKLEEKSEK